MPVAEVNGLLRTAYCVLRTACCVLHTACCVLRIVVTACWQFCGKCGRNAPQWILVYLIWKLSCSGPVIRRTSYIHRLRSSLYSHPSRSACLQAPASLAGCCFFRETAQDAGQRGVLWGCTMDLSLSPSPLSPLPLSPSWPLGLLASSQLRVRVVSAARNARRRLESFEGQTAASIKHSMHALS